VKIALACQSILLEKSLEIFLKNYISAYKQCDFVISDKEIEIDKPLFFISNGNGNLNIPFSKSTLLLNLEKFYENLYNNKKTKKIDTKELEEKIEVLTNDFRKNLIKTIKEYYE
jgi:hypothetical protein